MQVTGVKRIGTKKVTLDRFFDAPTYVEIKMMSPYGRAKVREIAMESFDVDEVDSKAKTASVKARFAGMADRDMKTREVKLEFAFVSHTIQADTTTWCKELWDALDEADPRILDTVLSEIDSFGKVDEADPI